MKFSYEEASTIVWKNVIIFSLLHLSAFYGFYLLLFHAKLYTVLWTFILYQVSGLGITAGAHRLWAHRSYKAKLPLRIFLALANAMAYQNDIFDWSRDHRVHHKYTETNADPHNAKRGFFFSHIGWLLIKKHPDVIKSGKALDVNDLLADPVVKYQKKFYYPLMFLMCVIIPTYIPYAYWDESIKTAFFTASVFRLVAFLNSTWLVNSAAHLWGDRPYDKTINPAENVVVSALTNGEGHHNYHHTFPWDYSTSEWGWKFNATTLFIDLMGKIGLAYDLKHVSQEVIDKRRGTTGDKSTPWYDKTTWENHSKGL